MKAAPWQKEWNTLLKKEEKYISSRMEKKDRKLNLLLEEKLPEKLQITLESAFKKSFEAIFSKGTGIIEKTYKKDELIRLNKINTYAAGLSENRKTLRKFNKDAGHNNNRTLIFSGLSGLGMGFAGIGLPDIPVFTATVLKSIYETALNYGFDYDRPEEKYFILKITEGALSYGSQLSACNNALNSFIENPVLPSDYSSDLQIKNTAAAMSKELLYMKFLQGIPLVGTVGGVCSTVYLQRVQKYAQMKYYRRFLYQRKYGSGDDAC